MRKHTKRKLHSAGPHPVAVAILNRQTADQVLTPRISEHEALSAYQVGTADDTDHETLLIAANVGIRLAEQGIDPEAAPSLPQPWTRSTEWGTAPPPAPTSWI